MTYFRNAAAGLALILIMTPDALAQLSPAGGQSSGPAVQPRAVTPDFAPPALPGTVGTPGIATAPKVAKANQGDPTTQLFTAVNGNDYNSAQDALGRGADLTAQNTLGETPLDMAIALNENSITFLLISARNESGDNPVPQAVMTQSRVAGASRPARPARLIAPSAQMATFKRAPVPGNDPGTPDPSAGFLGFEPKN